MATFWVDMIKVHFAGQMGKLKNQIRVKTKEA
jgi:hypothetical protein